GSAAVVLGEADEGWLGDQVEVAAGGLDAHAALAGGFDDLPATPAGLGGGVDEDAEAQVAGDGLVQGVDALDDDQRGGVDAAGAPGNGSRGWSAWRGCCWWRGAARRTAGGCRRGWWSGAWRSSS